MLLPERQCCCHVSSDGDRHAWQYKRGVPVGRGVQYVGTGAAGCACWQGSAVCWYWCCGVCLLAGECSVLVLVLSVVVVE